MTEQPTGGAAPQGVAASAQDLVKVYGTGEAEVRALDGVTVDLDAGEFTAIMGPSGSGKSTLMHCLAGARHPDLRRGRSSATPTLGSLKDKALTDLRRDRIGFVFQAFNLVPTLTAEENILLPLRPRRAQARPGVVRHRSSTTVGLRDRLEPPAQRAVRRPAAARRRAPGRW